MILILTWSEDYTIDPLFPLLAGMPIFRFNVDQWRHYRWELTDSRYWIEDPTGRRCVESEVRAVYFRKLIFTPPYIDIPAGGNDEAWARAEITEFARGIRDLAYTSNRLALVFPGKALSKVRQMRLASRYFPVLAWRSCYRALESLPDRPHVVKTFAATPVSKGAHLMVQAVHPCALSPNYPWFLQDQGVTATHDVTVVYVNGLIFAFEFPRTFDGVDCRLPSVINPEAWVACTLTPDEEAGIHDMMDTLELKFGRFDFLKIDGILHFLEVNPNGQWGWLDADADNGLYHAVAAEIRRTWCSSASGDQAGSLGAVR